MPVAVLGHGARVRAGRVRRCRRAAPEPLHPRPDVVAVAADDGQVEHRHGDLGRVTTDVGTVRAQHARPCAAAPSSVVRRLHASPSCGRDPQGAALAAAAHDHRDRPGRPGVAGRLGQHDPVVAYALVPGAQRARMTRWPAPARRAARGPAGTAARTPRAPVPTIPAPIADERPAPGQRGQGGGGLRRDPRPDGTSPACTGCRAAARCRAPAIAPSVTHGSGIGSHARPTWGIWIRWSISASPANPASSAARATPRSQASGSSPHGKRDTCRTTAARAAVRRPRCGRDAAAGAGGAATSPERPRRTRSHPSASTTSAHVAHRAQLPGEHPGRHRTVARGVAAPALVVRGVEDARRPPAGRTRAAASASRAAGRVEPEGVDHGRQPRPSRAATIVSSTANASVEASRSCGPLPTTPRRASEETTSSAR